MLARRRPEMRGKTADFCRAALAAGSRANLSIKLARRPNCRLSERRAGRRSPVAHACQSPLKATLESSPRACLAYFLHVESRIAFAARQIIVSADGVG